MRSQKTRLVILFLVLALMTYMGYRHQTLGGGANGSPGVHALCPFGGIEGAAELLRSGAYITRLAPSSFILLGALLAVTVIFGRVFCGWICPLGALNEISALAAKKLGIRQRVLPEKLDAALRNLKYILLAGILIATWITGVLFFSRFDPWTAWMHLTSGEIGRTLLPLSALGLVLFAGLFIERAWCRYLCPLGACLGILQKISFTKVRRDAGVCVDCSLCDRACPVGLSPSKASVVAHGDCIACGRCVENCPKGAACLSFKFRGAVLTPARLGALGVFLFAVQLCIAAATGHWRTEAPSGGVFLPSQLRGWMSLRHVSEISGVPAAALRDMAGIPADHSDDEPMGHDWEPRVRESLSALLRERPSGSSSVPEE